MTGFNPAASDVTQFFKVLADETRLAVVQQLAFSDRRVSEIVECLQVPQNAVSYHLKQLRALGLLRDQRSSADGRDVYYSVDLERLRQLYHAAGSALHPGIYADPDVDARLMLLNRPLRVLFLCTHNSARSQLAEGIMRYLGGANVEVFSAGSQPSQVHPLALELLAEWQIDTSRHISKSLEAFRGQLFDYIITVCDRVRDNCPTFPGDPAQIHWSLSDPAAITDEAPRRSAFLTVRRELSTRIRYLLCLPHPAMGQRTDPVSR
jgi:ArsR family transcriptional regulator, arsenate/arsenite/antimonite-responsive transcriptional repressor / arsenate reductase (thioredoxin)